MATNELLDLLSEKTLARLFPVGKDANHERGITSIFLATLSVVNVYASSVLHSIERKIGVRSRIECHTEIIFPNTEGSDRPDGLIILRKSGKIIWTALIEAKIGNSELNEDQISRYLEIAREHKINAVITISNQFAALPTHHPVKVNKKLTRSVDLLHWSWTFLRTQADYQLRVEEDIDMEQAYILQEMVRYFDDKSSGVKTFDRMNKEWKNVCLKVKNQERLLKSSDEVENTVSAWHQQQRDISLMMTTKLGSPVVIKLKQDHKSNPEKRLKDDIAAFCDNESLICQFDISNASSLLTVEASLTNRTISCSMELQAPSDRKTTKARVNWLIRQLIKADQNGIRIGAKWPRSSKNTWATLEELRDNPNLLQTKNTKLTPHRFIIQTVIDHAGKFSGQRTFVEGLEKTVTDYYHNIGENLTAWVPNPPKIDVNLDKEPNDNSGN